MASSSSADGAGAAASAMVAAVLRCCCGETAVLQWRLRCAGRGASCCYAAAASTWLVVQCTQCLAECVCCLQG